MGASCSLENVMGFSRTAGSDAYKWTFELEPKKEISREELLRNAEELKKQL
jgi:hypothetical protein